MKPTDLMIGDWVWNTHNQKPEKVMEIYETGVMLDYAIYGYDEIEPIKLTPEISAKNDFMYSAANQGYMRFTPLVYNNLVGGNVVMKFQEGSAQVFVHEGIGLIGFNGMVSYLHELQHILRSFVEWEITI